jgi:glycerol-3-phosphate O-acyltransferase/dihydroxyacetone phosphate acyltransferase
MIYEFFRIPLLILLFSFYRRIYWANAERMPKKVPMIIIANHSTAFVEQILVASMLRRGVYFWARASVFTNPIAKWFYKQVHILPIMRAEDGLTDRKQNQATFEQTYDYLLSGKAIFIAPEGNSVMEKRLRRFRTGTARVALGAAAKTNFEQKIAILPIGVNYTHHQEWRADVMVSFGEVLWVEDFKEEYEHDPQRAAKIFSQAMYNALRKEVIHIESEGDEELLEQLYILYRNDQLPPIGPRFQEKTNACVANKQLLGQLMNWKKEPSKSSNKDARLIFKN